MRQNENTKWGPESAPRAIVHRKPKCYICGETITRGLEWDSECYGPGKWCCPACANAAPWLTVQELRKLAQKVRKDGEDWQQVELWQG